MDQEQWNKMTASERENFDTDPRWGGQTPGGIGARHIDAAINNERSAEAAKNWAARIEANSHATVGDDHEDHGGHVR